MKKEQKERLVNDALNHVDEKFIEEAASVHKSRNKMWIPALAAAAVLLIAAVIGIPALTKSTDKDPTAVPGHITGTEAPEGTAPAGEASKDGEVTVINGSDYKDSKNGALTEEKTDGFHFLDGLFPEKEEPAALPGEASGMPYSDGHDTADPGAVDSPDIITEPVVIEDPALPEIPVQEPDPGQLTAGAWDDNAHYALFRTLFQKEDQGTTAGKFAAYAEAENQWFKHLQSRIRLRVTNGAEPVAGMTVSLAASDDSPVIASAVTDANGFAYFFYPTDVPYQVRITSNGGHLSNFNMMAGENEVAADLSHVSEWAGWDVSSLTGNVIELMYVIDVTGSMGDELSYLKSELADVVKKVTEANPDAVIRLSFLCYRDDSDEEKIYYSDFRDVTDPEGMKAQLDLLKLQDAMGGGDYEEAVDEALMFAAEKNWSENSTKLVFHFLDAPAHDTPEHRERYAAAVKMAAEKGIRLCPVLASGSDTQTEYLTRAEAVLTGGTFVFLTDDSGIGFSHHEPQLPDAVHEYLNALMIRLINGYYTGTFADPVAWNAE